MLTFSMQSNDNCNDLLQILPKSNTFLALPTAIGVSPVLLHEFRYFLAVAEELHFGRAAKRLHIAQPPLSRQIRALERRMGVVLFNRTKRKVELTEAGEVFRGEARRAVDQVDHAIVCAQQVTKVGHLRVTYSSSVAYNRVFSVIVREYRKAHPELMLGFREMTTERQLEALADEQIDVSFVLPPISSQPSKIIVVPLTREPLFAALHQEHSLTASAAISFDNLVNETLILSSRANWLYDRVLAVFRQKALQPAAVEEASQISDAISLAAAGVGIALLPESACSTAALPVVFRPLSSDFAPVDISLAYRNDETWRPVRSFVALARDTANRLAAALDARTRLREPIALGAAHLA